MDKSNETKDSSNGRTLTVRHDDAATGLKVLNLLDEKQLASAEVFLKKVIASPKSGITNINDGLAILMRAQDLQLPFSTCIEHIHVVNGKTTADIHIIKSLLSRAGVIWECTKDYTPQYQYTDGNTIYIETQIPTYCVKCRTADEAVSITQDSNGDKIGIYPIKWYVDLANKKYNEFQISDKCKIAINPSHAQKLKAEGYFPVIRVPAVPVDYVTEYKFTRYKFNPVLNKPIKQIAVSHFSYSEALTAQFFEKDTYKKYARVMIGHRAFTLGARDIASDVLMGVLEEIESAQINGGLDYAIENAEYEEVSQE
ncbi:MAG: hypothetical protein IJG68_01745 [Bacilli bacterium]|nr:hypothetical protein [Bacilli bacterium]